MKFEIRPHPEFPYGGHAQLIVPRAALGSGRMAMRRLYDDRYLGIDGWQAARTLIGPFETSPVDSGYRVAVALGPEVVDCMVENSGLEIDFENGGKDGLLWPDDIDPSPDAATGGGLQSRPKETPSSDQTPQEGAAQPSLARPSEAPDGEARPARSRGTEEGADRIRRQPEAPATPPSHEGRGARSRSRRLAAIAAVLVLGVIAAALVAPGMFSFRDDDETDEAATEAGIEPEAEAEAGIEPEPEAEPEPETEADACSNAAFAAERSPDPETVMALLSRCAGEESISPEARLSAVERVLDRSPEALVVMGRWYDPRHFDEHGSPFDVPAVEIAARYYFEAKQAGVDEADALLRGACEALDPDDLIQGDSRRRYCQE